MATNGHSQPKGLVGGIGLTHLTVYQQRPGPDGVHSGCAHVHGLTAEAYFVLSGTGAIDLHDLKDGYRQVPLGPGDYVQFPPNTLHRSISHDNLVVLAIMTNAGLAERGDARIYFGADVDADPGRFEELKALPKTKGLEGALARRDASITAYMALMEMWQADRRAYERDLTRFFDLHRANMADLSATFEPLVQEGPGAWLADALARLGGSLDGTRPLASAGTGVDQQPTHLGMCGVLRQLGQLEPR